MTDTVDPIGQISILITSTLIGTLRRSGNLSEADYNAIFVDLTNVLNLSGFPPSATQIVETMKNTADIIYRSKPKLMVVQEDGSLKPPDENDPE